MAGGFRRLVRNLRKDADRDERIRKDRDREWCKALEIPVAPNAKPAHPTAAAEFARRLWGRAALEEAAEAYFTDDGPCSHSAVPDWLRARAKGGE